MSYIPRIVDREILEFIGDSTANKSILLVEGARQVGEIDFVVKRGMGTCPIECKASLTFDRKNIRGICEYLAMYRQHFGVVVSLAPQAVFSLPGNLTVVNVPIYLLERLSHLQAPA